MNPFRLSTRLQPAARAPARARPRERLGRGSGDRVSSGRVGGDVLATGDSGGAAAAVDPEVTIDTAALEVPWRVVNRSASGVIEVGHQGVGPLHSVRFALAGHGMLGLSLPRTVFPGERLRVVLRGSSADDVMGARDSMLMLRWFQPDGREFLWPIAL